MERLNLRVNRISDEAEDIRSFELVDPEGGALPPFTAGAHLSFFLPNEITRHYSLANDPLETHRYVVAVLREEGGSGGSAHMHDQIREGDSIEITTPLNNFRLVPEAERSVLIAGGIGITPIMAMVRHLEREGADYTLHYCTRTPEKTAFMAELQAPPFDDKVQFHHDGGDPSKGLDVSTLLVGVEEGTHLFCCGPTGLMTAVRQASAHWPAGRVHFEYFAQDPSVAAAAGPAQSFEVEIASSGQVLVVPPDQSILEVLEKHGIEVESLCTEGLCGTCITGVLEGIPEHHDVILDDDEKASNKLMTVCCSRAKSPRLKLDL